MENKKEIIGFICKTCSELIKKELCTEHTIETYHYGFEPVYKKEIISFICKTCKKELAIGTCGIHREETDHRDFQEVFNEPKEEKNDIIR